MSKNLKVRVMLVLICGALALLSLAPTLIRDGLPEWWRNTFDPIHLGLDLQGGMHLVLGVDVNKALESRLDSTVDEIESQLRQDDIIFKKVLRGSDETVSVIVYDDVAASQIETLVKKQFPDLEFSGSERAGEFFQRNYRFSARVTEHIKDYAVRQAVETMRNRIDQFGVTEPILQRQSDDRILIQLPGVKDPQRAIDLLGKTARLEFKMVADVPSEDARKGLLPPGTRLLYEKRVNRQSGEVTELPIVVFDKTILTGDLLSDAQVRIDNRYNEPYVSIDFNSLGAKRFDQVTAANVGKRLAIILDDTIYSAPVIRERISGGNAMISGAFNEQEATDLAIVLRAGSLPAPVHILEDRTVGPSLGRDSINKGVFSTLIGGFLVVIAMLLYYRLAGLIANIALLLNLVFILALLALFKASLTLPGIAGIVLTVGMAVDANVLIFERIREELRRGQTPRLALEEGFSKAFWTIIDANVTTLIAALVLFQFGTGPVKGFAVTLSIGIVCSLFTAMFVSRVIFDYFMEKCQIKHLSI